MFVIYFTSLLRGVEKEYKRVEFADSVADAVSIVKNNNNVCKVLWAGSIFNDV